MFHTGLMEIAGNQNEAGKKSGPKGGASAIRNNFEFQKLLRDVEAEMIRIGKDGRTKADRHPKMVKTLELVRSAVMHHETALTYFSCSIISNLPTRTRRYMA
jgi:hypothetical protein